MKLLQSELVPPPNLDPYKRAILEFRIDALVKSYEDAMTEFCAKLARFEAMHRDDMKFRAKEGTIFEKSNIQVPICKSIAINYAAKLYQILVGEALLQCKPQGIEDKLEAEKFQKYFTFELDDEVHISDARAKTLQIVSVKGTAVTKRRWKTVASYFNRLKPQLHDEQGQPVFDHMGKPVGKDYPQADFPHENILYRMAGMTQKRLDFGGQPGPMLRPDSEFRNVQTKEKIVHYDNLEIVNIRMDDFICDLTVEHIDDSELKGHRYDEKLWEVWAKIAAQAMELQEMGNPLPQGELPPGWIRENVDLLKTIKGDSAAEGSADGAKAREPQENLGEKSFGGISLSKEEAFKTCHFVEVYLKHDTDGDGLPEDIIGIFETTLKKLVYLDWHVSSYVDCKSPFETHRIFPVPDRWIGMPPYEVLAGVQDFIDHVFNRINYRAGMNANPGTWIDPSVFSTPPSVWGPGCKFIVKPGQRGDLGFGFFVQPVVENIEVQHLQMFISLAQMISGVLNPGSSTQVGNLKGLDTAAGVNAMAASQDLMIDYHVASLLPSLERETEGAVRLIQQNLNAERVFRYAKGMEVITAVVTPEQIRELNFDIKIKLNKAGDQQKIQATQLAIQVITSFIALPAAEQLRLRGMFVSMLQAMGFVEADDLVPSIEELQKDQQNDQSLQEAGKKIAEAIQKIQGANLDPSKIVVQDLLASLQMIQAAMAKPAPDSKQGLPPIPTGLPGGGTGGAASAPEPPPDQIPPEASPMPQGPPPAPQMGAPAQAQPPAQT